MDKIELDLSILYATGGARAQLSDFFKIENSQKTYNMASGIVTANERVFAEGLINGKSEVAKNIINNNFCLVGQYIDARANLKRLESSQNHA